MVINLAGVNKDNGLEMGFGFLEVITDPVFVLNYKAQIVYINEEAAGLCGYGQYELVGQSVFTLRGTELQEAFFSRLKELKNIRRITFKDIYKKKDGSTINLIIRAFTLLIGGEEMVICILRDSDNIAFMVDGKNEESVNGTSRLKQIVNSLTTITEVRDPYTANHQKRVANLARAMAKELDFDYDRMTGLYIAGILHDIGKIYVPNEILTRPGSINEYEFNIIKKHSEVGYSILNKIMFPWPVSEFVLQHHERVDGTGYPYRLTGENIHLEAKILAVADVVESISSHRPYRPALGIESALEEIVNGRGTLYDEGVVDSCIKVFEAKSFDFDRSFMEQF